jgi:phage shock protein C
MAQFLLTLEPVVFKDATPERHTRMCCCKEINHMESRKLYRSESDRMVAGVCSGLGKYLNIDPTIVRLIFVLMFLLGGHGLLVYVILWIVMPVEIMDQASVEVVTKK